MDLTPIPFEVYKNANVDTVATRFGYAPVWQRGSDYKYTNSPQMPDIPTVDDLIRLHQYWQTNLKMNFCIAGGCVRDAILGKAPKDIDVFILSIGAASQVVDIATRFAANSEFLSFDAYCVDEEHPLSEDGFSKADCGWKDFRIQIIWNDHERYEDTRDLLSTFDWNCCQFAIDHTGLVSLEKPENIGPGKALRIVTIEDQHLERTARRGRGFANRYGMILPMSEIRRLAKRRRDIRKEFQFNQVMGKAEKTLEIFNEILVGMT